VERTGSINQAARDVGLSYKGAWEMVERANNLSLHPLNSTATGGKQGGGTQLTPEGTRLLRLFTDLKDQHQTFLHGINQQIARQSNLSSLFQRSVMRVSARNQLFGQVIDVKTGQVTAELSIRLKGDSILTAAITRESAESLEITPGQDVVALIKASQIMLVRDFGGYRLSARNQLNGRVSRIESGEVNVEVIIELQGGDSLAAIITRNSLQVMNIMEGDSITAVFKAGAVIVGVAGK
jgi:molybdate transport system regulatory protein